MRSAGVETRATGNGLPCPNTLRSGLCSFAKFGLWTLFATEIEAITDGAVKKSRSLNLVSVARSHRTLARPLAAQASKARLSEPAESGSPLKSFESVANSAGVSSRTPLLGTKKETVSPKTTNVRTCRGGEHYAALVQGGDDGGCFGQRQFGELCPHLDFGRHNCVYPCPTKNFSGELFSCLKESGQRAFVSFVIKKRIRAPHR